MTRHGNGQSTRSRNGTTRKALREMTRKELASLAQRLRIPGWHPMRKSELVDALHQAVRKTKRPRGTNPNNTLEFSAKPTVGIAGAAADLLVALPVSSRWISVRWNVSPKMLTRAQSALGSNWHRARAVLRLVKITEESEGPTCESRVRDVDVEIETGECCMEVDRVGLPYRTQLGFTVPGHSDFFVLSHSDPVTTPRGSLCDNTGSPGPGPVNHQHDNAPLPLEIYTDLVIYGHTAPETLIELEHKSVKAGRDGRFELRLSLENGRQFVPATATAADLSSKRNVALSVERHLKLLDPEPVD